MTIPTIEEARLSPLRSDSDIEQRAAGLVGRANLRQLWLMFLDERDIQLPELTIIDDLPSQPNEDADLFVQGIAEYMLALGATSFVTVWERYGSERLTAQDAAWARAVDASCAALGVRLRAQLLSHRTGVRLLESSDYELA